MSKGKFPKGSVCKPCWELKYCPYGWLVEYFPLHTRITQSMGKIQNTYGEILAELANSPASTPEDVERYFGRLSVWDPESNSFLSDYEPDDVGCRVWGHLCPVFFTQSGATETREPRREGRYIPREFMLKVVRRDNHVCQSCGKYVMDDKIEFDHIIPLSKGGPTSVENLRLLCRACNKKKSNAIDDLLVF